MAHILLGVTGSVATNKIYILSQKLSEIGIVKIICTKSSKIFFDSDSIRKKYSLYEDKDDELMWNGLNRCLHIDLVKWADIFIIAPITANTIAKIANGLSDNLLTNIIKAWNYKKPFYIAPAMNVLMWKNKITKEHIKKIRGLKINIINPIIKKLACGDIGIGAMAETNTIFNIILKRLN